MTRRGFTLIELLMAIAIFGILLAAIGRVYASTIDQDARLQQGREKVTTQTSFESQISDLLRHSYLSADTTSQTTYFVATDNGNGADTITFTRLGDRPNQAFLDSDQDFESLNQTYGPQGGVEEVSISTTAVGTAPINDAIYLREQRPADGDPTQGGYESVLHRDVKSLTFEFWDGTAWIATWDTREQTTPRLPAAIRMTYRYTDDTDDRYLIVRLPASNVTNQNPLEDTTTQ